MSEAPPESEPDAVPAPQPARRDRLPMLVLVGWMVLAIALIWLWRHPAANGAADARALAGLGARVAALEQRAAGLASGLAALRTGLAAAAARETRLGLHLDQLVAGQSADRRDRAAALAALAGRVTAAAATAARDQAGLAARVGALEKRPTAAVALAAIQASLSALGQRQDALAARQLRLSSRAAAEGRSITTRLAVLDAALAKLATEAGAVPALSARAERLAAIATAESALAAGRPLGPIAGAPPALARFATEAPPTEAALRVAFPAAARAALAASRPAAPSQGFFSGVWSRLGTLVTIRRGDRVILGDPAAGVIARARGALDSGDLPGAVAALRSLKGGAATAMAGWIGQAQALLAARAALATMAAAG